MKKHVLALLVGSMLGTLLAFYINQMVAIPPVLSAVIILFFILLSMGIFAAVIQEPAQQEKLEAAGQTEKWAWLVPADAKLSSGYPLNADSITVGRDVGNRIMLNDDSVSRFHAEIVRAGENFLVRDLGSTNGTFLNGLRVKEQLVVDGDRVGFGDAAYVLKMPKAAKPKEPDAADEFPAEAAPSETFVDF